MHNNTSSILAALAFAAAFCACEPANTDAPTAESSDAVTLTPALTCNDVFTFVETAPAATFTSMSFTYIRGASAVAGLGFPEHDSNSVDVTSSSVSTETYDSVNADRAVINFRKTFIRLGTTLLQRTSKVAVELYRSSNGATLASFDVGVVECTVNASNAVVTAEDANGGRLIMVFNHTPIGG